MKPVPDFATLLAHEEPAFGAAVTAILRGDQDSLRKLLREHPELVRARSRSAHQGTLLHYVAANGIEDDLQRTPPNAVEIAEILLQAGSEVDALCGTYGGGPLQTTLNLLVSSCHPAEAGVQAELVEVLCRAGAKVNGVEDDGSPLGVALAFGYPPAFEKLVQCGARLDNLVFAAAAGRTDLVADYFKPDGSLKPETGDCRFRWFKVSRDPGIAAQQALVFACMCGQAEVVEYLLDRGVDVNAYPRGSHMTATALHTAALLGHEEVVRLLLTRGADRTIRDHKYESTPLGWAEYFGKENVARLLR